MENSLQTQLLNYRKKIIINKDDLQHRFLGLAYITISNLPPLKKGVQEKGALQRGVAGCCWSPRNGSVEAHVALPESILETEEKTGTLLRLLEGSSTFDMDHKDVTTGA